VTEELRAKRNHGSPARTIRFRVLTPNPAGYGLGLSLRLLCSHPVFQPRHGADVTGTTVP
jgi:hypothetical protein